MIPALGPAWLPSVAPIDEWWRVGSRVKMGEGISTTEGELVHGFQMTERWNEDIFGTGGRGLKMSLS